MDVKTIAVFLVTGVVECDGRGENSKINCGLDIMGEKEKKMSR